MTRYACFATRWGFAAIVCSDDGICGACLPGPSRAGVRHWVARTWPGARPDPTAARDIQEQFREYFAGRPVCFVCDLDLRGLTDFRRQVLERCRRIPYGQVMTYGELAGAVGRAGAARAVGQCMAANPIPLIIPCHRVVAADGRAGGFSAPGGAATKRRMLELEGIDVSATMRTPARR